MKRAAAKSIIFIGYFIAVFILQRIDVFQPNLVFFTSFLKDLIFWLLGAFLGAHFLKLDQFLYVYFTKPNEPLSFQVKNLVKQKQFAKVWDMFDSQVHTQRHLAIQSFLFQIVWAILAIFALTSTVSLFGKALVMAIGLKLLLEEWDEILRGGNLDWIFWQIKRPIGQKEQQMFLYIMTGFYSLLTLLLI
jgi:hypothetical protein